MTGNQPLDLSLVGKRSEASLWAEIGPLGGCCWGLGPMVDSAEVRPRLIDLLIVLLVASILRFGLLASAWLHGCDLVARSDEHGYHLLAVNLARHHVFTMAEPVGPTGRPEVGRTPAFPALMALIYLAVGSDPMLWQPCWHSFLAGSLSLCTLSR